MRNVRVPQAASLPANRFYKDRALVAGQGQLAFLDGGLQLHAALGQIGQRLGHLGRQAEHLELFLARELAFQALPPDLGCMVEAVHQHVVRLVAGLGDRLFFGLAHFDPDALGAGEVGQVHIRVVRVGQAGAKAQGAVAIAQVLQLVGVQGQRHQAHHHALVGFAGVARQGQVVVGVVVVVDIGNRQIGLVDRGFDSHGAGSGDEAWASGVNPARQAGALRLAGR